MELIPQLLIFLVLLSIVVGVHEFGHYLAGRSFGAAAESFSIGFGKSLVERTDRRGTRWRINAIPLGGFVKFTGEQQLPGDGLEADESARDAEGRMRPVGKPFSALTPLQRIVVALAGPFANFVLASVCFAVIFGALGQPLTSVRVKNVIPGGAAEAAGFVQGDLFISVDGEAIENFNDVLIPVSLSSGKSLTFVVERDGIMMDIPVVPERQDVENQLGQSAKMGRIGVEFVSPPERVEMRRYSPLEALPAGIVETGSTIAMSSEMLLRLFTGREPISNLKGPVGIADTTRRAIDVNMDVTEAPLSLRLQGAFWTLVQLTALISVGIGLVNLLPLPVLDGGHVVFNLWEMLSGKAVPQKVQDMSLTIGLFMLFGVAIIVTWHDVVGTGVLKAVGAQ